MNAYKITYTNHRTGEEITATRAAETATEAIEKLCNRYRWSYRLNMYDADTRGLEWSECWYDPDGGYNYNRRIVAVIKEEA